MRVETFSLGPIETNSYLAVEGSQAVAVDAGGDPAPMFRYLSSRSLTLTHILLTHLHFDHTYGAKALQTATGAAILAGAKDAYLLKTELGRGGFMEFPLVEQFDYTPADEGEIELLGQPCKVLATPGHSPGSLSYYFPRAGAVFSGDLIFHGSVGRTDFPGGSQETLLASVKEKIFTLAPVTIIYPGHGPETSASRERLHNPYFSDFAG